MADKQAPEQPEDDEAIKRIDAMMSVNEVDGTPAVSTSVDLEHFEKPKTAPKLPSVYKPKEPAKPPIVIKLADETPPSQITPAQPQTEPQLPPPLPESTEEPPAQPGSPNLNDQATDQAVDDIAAKESDMVLAVEDAQKAKKGKVVVGKPPWKERFREFFGHKRLWAGLLVLLVVVLGVPFVRYPVLGLFIKKPVNITVIDSKTGTPVSSAEVTLAGDSVKTDAEGQAHLKAALGKRTLTISKQYYQNQNQTYFVGFKSPKQPTSIHLVATGRLVPITVLNGITGKPLSGAEVAVKGTTAKTSSKGQATVALPATAATYSATITLGGYNSANVTVQVTAQTVKANSFNLIPAGHIYFLSNQSGTIDVVKSNLDGSGRKTVLAGTGHEDPNSTSLLASRDWRFLVLKSIRSGSNASLSLIDTSNDKVTSFDTSDADFNLVGWYGHNFIYDLTRHGQDAWQAGREILKSYDADNQQLNQLDQNQAEGSAGAYASQYFSNFYILNGVVAYDTQWSNVNGDLTGKNFTIRAVQPNGQGKKDYQTFPAGTTTFIQATLYNPQAVYYAVSDNTGKTSYYDFENLAVKPITLDSGSFSRTYPTFLISPGGNQTFWTELRDGQNTLFIGDGSADNQKQIASLSDYSPYGWFSNSYVLVSKNSSELYIMPAGSLSAGQQPVKITDYYKPAQTFNGYGYGYGGL
ncbi:MAG TPA: hypothetical protein VH234_01965 [Candidatus Saccharimonadales bacterium]|jgi:hypothetical protein|nr:hypothetical protein [Candidatus Saccharimonadales bacterium]